MRRESRGGGQGRSPMSKNLVRSTNNDLLHVNQIEGKYHPSLSLQDEARNTEHNHLWNPDHKLRHARVAFVSVGHDQHDLNPVTKEWNVLERELPTDPSLSHQTLHGESIAGLSLQDHHLPPISFSSAGKSQAQNTFSQPNRVGHAEGVISAHSSNEFFFTDVNGTLEPIRTNLPQPTIRRSSSPSLSISSEEVILFSGRKNNGSRSNNKSPIIPAVPPLRKSQPNINVGHLITSQCLPEKVVKDPVLDVSSANPRSPTFEEEPTEGFDCNQPPISISLRPKKKKASRKLNRRNELRDDALADYISNIQNSGDNENSYTGTLLSIPEISTCKSPTLPEEQHEFSVHQCDDVFSIHNKGRTSSGLHSLDDLSTSSEDIMVVKRVLSKRRRRSGLQYLVVGENQSVNKARWISSNSVEMLTASDQVRIYEDEHLGIKEHSLNSNDSDDDYICKSDAAVDLQDELDSIKDEQDLLERTIAQMADEKIARLLSKQEELGLGSSDIVLFDGNGFENDDEFTISLDRRHHSLLRSNRKEAEEAPKKHSSTKALGNAEGLELPDGIDITDRNQFNLRETYRGRRGMLMPKSGDIYLENAMQAAWQKDRTKKKIQKQEREKLRQLGLIGKKSKSASRTQHVNDISVTELKEKMRDFLKSPAESLSLPPMDPKDRKSVHQIASILGLKSKSSGGGNSRFPVLQKTPRTTLYDQHSIDAIISQFGTGRHVQRRAQFIKQKPTIIRGSRRGGSNSAVSYRDGEVVGAAAPELGEENKGRAMLEKMGWSTGTALGASNNKGIMQPLAQVVKTTKAGLG